MRPAFVKGCAPSALSGRASLRCLVSIGLVSLLLATLEHRQNVQMPGTQHPGSFRSLMVTVAALIAILGILALIVMIFRQ